MITTDRRRLTEPLESVTGVFLTLLLLGLAVFAALTVFSSNLSLFGGPRSGEMCITEASPPQSVSGPASALDETARRGISISVTGGQQVCTLHASTIQRVLYLVTATPSLLFWCCLLLLTWRLIRMASRNGPFTPQVARSMRRLGWFIIAGSALVAVAKQTALGELMDEMVRPAIYSYGAVIFPAARALVPVPALVGAALLTFARIVRLGAAMDDEIKGTV